MIINCCNGHRLDEVGVGEGIFQEWVMLGEGTLWFRGFNEMQDLKRVDWLLYEYNGLYLLLGPN